MAPTSSATIHAVMELIEMNPFIPPIFAIMEAPIFNQFADIETREMTPGYFSKIIHTANNTINFLEIKAGSVSAMHQHINHQCAFVIEGQFELTVAGVTRILDTGTYAIIPPNVIHGGRAITDCKMIDIFDPVREDFKM